MNIETIIKVTSRAWSLEILSLMFDGTAGRQAPLLAASGASRTAFTQSLLHLLALKMLERNPGHGHPLRPEYRLTPEGAEVAAMANKIKILTSLPSQNAIIRRAWIIPVLAVSQKPRYFSEIKSDLSSVTDRALSQTLQQLQTNDWLKRDIDIAQRPPRPLYQASNIGIEISQAIGLLG